MDLKKFLDTLVDVDDENYEAPPVELLKQGSNKTTKGSKKALTDTATKLQKTLYTWLSNRKRRKSYFNQKTILQKLRFTHGYNY